MGLGIRAAKSQPPSGPDRRRRATERSDRQSLEPFQRLQCLQASEDHALFQVDILGVSCETSRLQVLGQCELSV